MKENHELQKSMRPLLDEAAKRLGTTPEDLKQRLNSGDIQGIMNNMPKQQQSALAKTLSDKAACEKLLNSPQAQALIKKLSQK
jgi:hypothetical protein